MPPLLELQSDFRRFICGDAPAELFDVIDGASLNPPSILSIYRNNTMISLADALTTTFPVVSRLVGPEFFKYAAYAFIAGHLPSGPCLVEYGSDFPTFLAGFEGAADLAYLADVAHLEWAINRVTHAPAISAIELSAIANVTPDLTTVRLWTNPAIRFVTSAFPVDEIWDANQPGVEPDEMKLERRTVHLQVRRTDSLRIGHLPLGIWAFRALIADGKTLGAAIDAAFAADPNFHLPSALVAIFQDRLIAGISE